MSGGLSQPGPPSAMSLAARLFGPPLGWSRNVLEGRGSAWDGPWLHPACGPLHGLGTAAAATELHRSSRARELQLLGRGCVRQAAWLLQTRADGCAVAPLRRRTRPYGEPAEDAIAAVSRAGPSAARMSTRAVDGSCSSRGSRCCGQPSYGGRARAQSSGLPGRKDTRAAQPYPHPAPEHQREGPDSGDERVASSVARFLLITSDRTDGCGCVANMYASRSGSRPHSRGDVHARP